MRAIACFLVALTLIASLVAPTSAQGISGISASSLRCEYLTDPLAIETLEPRLSWRIESKSRGAKQTAYQILVASQQANLAANKGDLWDTGKIASSETIQITYRGKKLESRQRCFWKVRVWDQNGQASSWSPRAQWTMGLLQPADWSAK